MTNLPDMVVEKRDSKTAHAVPAPDLSKDNMALQVQEAIQLNEDAKQRGWQDTTIDILKKYLPLECTSKEIADSVKAVSGHNGWDEVSKFVIDDMCLEFFNKALKYCLEQSQAHKENMGFIDGSGIGYATTYIDRLKVTLEQCFDAKYYYKVKRPLEYLRDEMGMDLSKVANAIHPGHRAYPAGHGCKFLTAIEVLNDVFKLSRDCYKTLLIDACVQAMGRSGNLIHFPMDNLASGPLTTLKEFQK